MNDIAPPSGNEEVARLEAEVALKREELASSLSELRERVARATDWRRWCRERPFTALGLALLLGWMAGRRTS